MMRLRFLTTLPLCLLILGCETFQPPEKQGNTLITDEIQRVQQDSRPVPGEPPLSDDAILDTLLPATTESLTEEEPRFDVSVKDIDARSFLMGLVDSTPYNLVVADNIQGKISLQLKNVTVNEVLDAVERIYPIIVERHDKLILVSSAESMTVVYPVDYLNLKRKGKSHTSVAGQAIQQAQGQNQSGNRQAGGNRGGNQNQAGMMQNSSEIETISEADFWKNLKESLSLMVANEENASVVVSPHAGVVVVRALPRTQRLIEEYLGVTQAGLNRQVILEAKILEVTLNEGFQSGIDWSKISTISGDSLTFGTTGQVLLGEQSENPINGIFSLFYEGNKFNAAIELLKSQGDVQVLSSPRVSTVNNQKAVIKVGSDEFFVTDVSTTTVTGTSTATTPDVTLTPFFSGISLDVTPQISEQNEIILHIHPVVSEVKDQQKTITLGSEQFTLPLALTNVRESDSIVRTRAGQVIVIGGLMQNRIQTTESGAPLLKDIPVFGSLFKQNREFSVKSELVILLKASIVDSNYSRKDLDQMNKRLQGR